MKMRRDGGGQHSCISKLSYIDLMKSLTVVVVFKRTCSCILLSVIPAKKKRKKLLVTAMLFGEGLTNYL